MKIECSGPNGETFECEWELKTGNVTSAWQQGAKEWSEFQRDAAQKALETWCAAFKPKEVANDRQEEAG